MSALSTSALAVLSPRDGARVLWKSCGCLSPRVRRMGRTRSSIEQMSALTASSRPSGVRIETTLKNRIFTPSDAMMFLVQPGSASPSQVRNRSPTSAGWGSPTSGSTATMYQVKNPAARPAVRPIRLARGQ